MSNLIEDGNGGMSKESLRNSAQEGDLQSNPLQQQGRNVIAARFAIGDRLAGRNGQYVAVLCITVIAIALRLYKLGEWSFWIDEIFTVNRIQAHYSELDSILRNLPPRTNWLPVSLLATSAVMKAVGVSEWSARLAPAVIGILSIPVLYFPTRKVFGVRVALVFALLLAVSPWHINWSQNARFYTSLMLFFSLALFAFHQALEQDRLIYGLLFVVFVYLGASERLLGLLIIPVIAVYLVLLAARVLERPPGFRPRNMLLFGMPVLVGGMIELISLIGSGTSRFFADFVFVGNSIEDPFTQTLFIAHEIGIPLLTLSLFTGLFLVRSKNRPGTLIFLGGVVPLVLVILATPLMFTEERYAFVTLPSWLLLGSIAVTETSRRLENPAKLFSIGILFLLLADSAGADILYYHINNGNRRDYKGAFALVRERSEAGDRVVSTWPEIGAYYLDREVEAWQGIDVAAIERGGNRVWIVVVPAMAWYWGNENVYWWVSHKTELVEVRYLRTPDDTNLFVYLYDPHRHATSENSD